MTRQIQKSKCYAGILLAAMALAAVPAAAQAVRGSGTTGFVPLWTNSSTLGNSALSQSGGNLTTGGNIIASGIRANAFTGNGATLSGSLSAGSVTAASFTGNGAALSNVNAAQLGGIAPSGFAQLGAASNPFSGTVSAATMNSTNPYQIGGFPVLSITGNSNLFVGQSAGTSNTGFANTAAGSTALYNNTTGYQNTAIGNQALFSNTTGSVNTGIGVYALYLNTTGSQNTATGFNALADSTTGSQNTAIGAYALFYSTAGSVNTALGDHALYQLGTGTANTVIGAGAGSNFTGSDSFNIDISNGGVAGESGVIRIGNEGTQTATYIAGIYGATTGSGPSPVVVDSNGQLGTIASSRRYKEDIHNMGAASDGLLHLRPVTFRYKKPYADGSRPIEYGLIAEEVAEVYPDLVVRGQDGKVETVQYYKLDAMLLNEIQKLAKQHAADQKEISKLQEQMQNQQRQVQEQQAAMKQLQDEIRVVKLTLAQSQPADANALAGSALAPEGPKAPARK